MLAEWIINLLINRPHFSSFDFGQMSLKKMKTKKIAAKKEKKSLLFRGDKLLENIITINLIEK